MQILNVNKTNHASDNPKDFKNPSAPIQEEGSIVPALSSTSPRAAQRRLKVENSAFTAKASPSDDLLDVLAKYANNPYRVPTINYAVTMRDEKAVAILLEHGMDVNMPSYIGSPLQIAIKQKDMALTKLLLQRNALITTPVLSESIALIPTTEYFELLLKNGFEMKKLEPLIEPLINSNKENALKIIVNSGFNLKSIPNGGEMLFKALQNRSVSTSAIKFLINNSISCDFTKINQTLPRYTHYLQSGNARKRIDIIKNDIPLMTAAVNRGDISIIKMLLDKGVKCDQQVSPCITFRCSSSINNSAYTVIIEEDINSNPLQRAISLNRTDIAELLMQHGAKPTIISHRILSDVKINEKKECARWHGLIHLHTDYTNIPKEFNEGVKDISIALDSLIKENKLTEKTTQGDQLLIAIKNNNSQIVKLLLEAGHPVNIVCAGNKYPIKIAAEKGNREIISLLLKFGAEWDGV